MHANKFTIKNHICQTNKLNHITNEYISHLYIYIYIYIPEMVGVDGGEKARS